MRRMRDLGVDGLFTNHPARLRKLLESVPIR
jgi:glycerophosphoryl diester phosphodiesterase